MSPTHITGYVLSGGTPVERARVTLWAATADAPAQLDQATTGPDGRFTVETAASSAQDTSLYLTAVGGRSSADKTGGLAMPGPYERHRLLALELVEGALAGACGLLRPAGRLNRDTAPVGCGLAEPLRAKR